MNEDNRNLILAIILSIGVIFVWQHFIATPQVEKQRQQQAQTTQTQPAAPGQPASNAPQPPAAAPSTAPALPGAAAPAGAAVADRGAVIAASPRVPLQSARLVGSVNLKGGRIDDLALRAYRETIDPKSPNIVLLSPSGTQHPFYVELGWVAGAGSNAAVPGPTTEWTPDSREPLSDARPLVLTWDNGQGLVFRRTIALDARYMFTITDEVENRGTDAVTLFNYGLLSRHGTPKVDGYYILHEGLIGVVGDNGLQEITYDKVPEEPKVWKGAKGGWLGFTDKYWAATLIPNQKDPFQGRFSTGKLGELKTYQTDFLSDPISLAAGGKTTASTRLFAGAKEVSIVDGYEKSLGIRQFDLLIDWGWFYFITKPLFWVIDWLFKLVGNFGVAILLVTVGIKAIFFPLANKSYASMAKMKALQPQMLQLRERYADDKMRQQQAMMELYKREKVNPLAGCWPVLVQVPVFFALYKVLFVTIEMRHTPFYGWIHDLAAPDPTNIFNLFGLIPWTPPALLPVLGAWPVIMGISMWIQMKMNPAPPDATQKMIFDWMPLIFTFMLASFPAGLVIYWTWNNLLSVIQQYFIMRKHGVKVELWDNLSGKKKTPAS